jgi:dCTP deaminase
MTLSKNEILERLRPNYGNGTLDERIIITPILDLKDQISIAGFDLRLGKNFIVFKEYYKGIFAPKQNLEITNEIRKFQEKIIVPIGTGITLHPNKFIIGSTLEYVSIPYDLECQVEGRSSWARLGLIIATATTVEPGYKGIITLELSNVGNVPIQLYPGIKIAQIIFHKIEAGKKVDLKTQKDKKYDISIDASFSKIYKDKYLDYFCKDEKKS